MHTPAPSAPDAAAVAAAYDHDDIDPVLVQNLPHPLKTKIKNNNIIISLSWFSSNLLILCYQAGPAAVAVATTVTVEEEEEEERA